PAKVLAFCGVLPRERGEQPRAFHEVIWQGHKDLPQARAPCRGSISGRRCSVRTEGPPAPLLTRFVLLFGTIESAAAALAIAVHVQVLAAAPWTLSHACSLADCCECKCTLPRV